MANPSENPRPKPILNLDQMDDNQLRNLAATFIQHETGCIASHLKHILDFPGIDPNGREELAYLMATCVIKIRDVIFVNYKTTFEKREADIEEVAQNFLNYES